MQIKQIVFTAPNTAELLDRQIGEPGEDEVIVKIAYTTISNGTEKANLIGDLNVYGERRLRFLPRIRSFRDIWAIAARASYTKRAQM